MPVIKYKTALERILRKPVFTPKDSHNEGIPENYAKKLLHLLAKSGRIRHIERGKYTNLDDPIAVAAYVTQPCYLSLWTALSIRNLTTQIPFGIEVVTSRKRFKRKIDFEGTTIMFHTVKPRMMFGYENIVWKENTRIPIANREKIVIDGVYLGGIPEDEILEIVKISNTPLLEKYAALTGDKTTIGKVKELIEKCSRKKR